MGRLLQARLALLLLAFMAAQQTGLAADGNAQLGTDPRGKVSSGNFGFAFMRNVEMAQPGGPGFEDTCKTIPKEGDNATLIVTDGVACPENPEPIIYTLVGDTAVFSGRTGNCYYMVTGQYQRAGRGIAGGKPPQWHSEFDSNVESPHFVLFVNERYRSDDDVVDVNGAATITVEVHNASPGIIYKFDLFNLDNASPDGGAIILGEDEPDGGFPVSEDEPCTIPVIGVRPGPVRPVASSTPTSEPTTQGSTNITVQDGTIKRAVAIPKGYPDDSNYLPLDDSLRTVLIGQQMNLKASVKLPDGVTVTSYKWTLPGTVFKNYTSDQKSATLDSNVDLTSQLVHFYWADGNNNGDREVTCKMVLSDNTTHLAKAAWRVKLPTVTLEANTAPTVIDANNEISKGTYLALGEGTDSNNAGITFYGSITVPKGFIQNSHEYGIPWVGYWRWAQTVSGAKIYTLADCNVWTQSTDGTVMCDGCPYPSFDYDNGNSYLIRDSNAMSEINFDSPWLGLDNDMTKGGADASFTMYIMFKPPGEQAMWVPTRAVNWIWKASASKPVGGSWSIDPGAKGKVVSAFDTCTHPVWKKNIHDVAWVAVKQ